MREYHAMAAATLAIDVPTYRPLYRKYNLGTTVFSALAGGFLTGKVLYHRPRLELNVRD